MNARNRDTWRKKTPPQARERLIRDLRRAAIVVMTVGLLVVLFRFLFPPFFASQTHLFLVGTGNNATSHIPPIAFVAEDQVGLATIDIAAIHRPAGGWRSAGGGKELGNMLRGAGLQKADTALVYLAAHGVSQDGKAYLLCDDFDLRRPDSGRVSVDVLLDEVARSTDAVKVIVLNAGAIDYDPRLGMVVNEFSRLLEQAVARTQDPTLWVYCSHSSMEHSHVSEAAQRSVFGMFATAGLQGAADYDKDGRVDLHELVSFASANVNHWVRSASGGAAEQTPRLMWGGSGDYSDPSPCLVTLRDENRRSAFDIADFILPTESIGRSSRPVQQSRQATGVLTRRHFAMASPQTATKATTVAMAAKATSAKVAKATSDSGNKAAQADADAADESAAESDILSDNVARARVLVGEAWQVRDEASRNWPAISLTANPIENVPHLWREFQAELLDFEQRLRAGAGVDAAAIAAVLAQTVQSDSGGTAGGQSVMALFRKSSEGDAKVSSTITGGAAHSLALARLIGASTGETIEIDIAGLEAALNRPQRQEMDEWIEKNLNDDAPVYCELRFIKRLAAAPQIPWDLIRLAGTCSLFGERVASLDLIAPGWIRQNVERADQFRFFGQELVFDQIGADWERRVRESLERAFVLYRLAETDFNEIRLAQQVRDRTFDKAPHYIRWFQRIEGDQVGDGPTAPQLSALLLTLAELTDRLQRPSQTRVSDVRSSRQELLRIRSQIEALTSDSALRQLVDNAPTAAEAWRAEQMLLTPLLSGSKRDELLSTIAMIDREFAVGYQPAAVDFADRNRRSTSGAEQSPDDRVSGRDWARMFDLASLQASHIRLFNITEPSFAGTASTDTASAGEPFPDDAVTRVVRDVENGLADLARRQRAMSGDRSPGHDAARDESPSPQPTTFEQMWRAYGTFGETVSRFYRELATSVDADGFEQSDEMVNRSLRMIDARDAWRARQFDIASTSVARRTGASLRWQSQRDVQALMYRCQPDCQATANKAVVGDACYRSDDSVLAVILQGPDRIDLQYDSDDSIQIELVNRGVRDTFVRLSFDYDRASISVSAVDDASAEILGSNVTDGTLASEPVLLLAGQRRPIKLRVVRQGQATESTKIVIDVRQMESSSQTVGTMLLARHKVDVVLPVGEIVVRWSAGDSIAVGGMSGQSASGHSASRGNTVLVNPFPNRSEEYKIGVVNRSYRSKRLSISLYDLDRDFDELSPADYPALLIGKQPLAQSEIDVAGVSAGNSTQGLSTQEPGRGTIVTFAATDVVDGPGDGAPKDAKPDGPDAADAVAKAPKARIQHGLLAVIKDSDSGQTTFRHIGFSVQRPRRFLQPRVGFNASTNRIEIAVAASDPSSVPPGKPVRVRCRLADSFPGSDKGRLEDSIKSPQFTANLFINMPSPSPSVVRLYIDVDDYPRAFIYDVPCSKHVADVPELAELADVRLAMITKDGFLAATDAIAVAVQIDAPIGSFDNGTDVVEMGIDTDGSGTPSRSSSVRLRTDRNVAIDFMQAKPGGVFELRSTVSDHEIVLPTARLANFAVNIVTRITLDGSTRQVSDVPLFIDTEPPIVGPIQPIKAGAFVPVGGQLELSAWAWDAGSGIARVEAIFDETGLGEFPDEGEFIKGGFDQGRKWRLSVPVGAEPGPRTLLVRGVDRVGNRSDAVSLFVEIVSLADGAALTSQQTVEITGMVAFRDELVPKAEVALTAQSADESAAAADANSITVRTDANGRYQIPGVAPGTYVLSTRGVLRNRVRRIEQTITVEPGPPSVMQIDVMLP